jgi:hypothetical protein
MCGKSDRVSHAQPVDTCTVPRKKNPVNNHSTIYGASAWSVILAGGNGSRLQSLTHNAQGIVVPKQFRSLKGGPCLLDDALRRASAVAPSPRVCTVVAAQHRRWWEGLARSTGAGEITMPTPE